ncbi:MAG: IPT/TIG domain-containing protein [Cytophagales bacterium]|nr:IPT/TIG domain-containing protein [Cytophagales bacterium]
MQIHTSLRDSILGKSLILSLFLFSSCDEDPATQTITLSSFKPKTGKIGTPVSLIGKGFGTDKSELHVFFHETSTTIESLDNQEIEVRVPEGASTGPISIQIRNQKLISPEDFSVLDESPEGHEKNSTKPLSREEFIRDYLKNYLVNPVPENWDGNVAECNPGTINKDAIAQALDRLNYFRRQVGLREPLILSKDLSAQCQKAALILAAEKKLTHIPKPNATCYSKEGMEASMGNLYLSSAPRIGFIGQTISKFIEDPGRGNERVGHRTWFLHPKLREIGVGYTHISGAVWWNFHDAHPKDIPEFISWPPHGYVVDELVYPRWSFHYLSTDPRTDKINLAKVRVLRKNSSEEIPIDVIARHNQGNFGLLSIVWTLKENVKPQDTKDVILSVTVSDLLIGGLRKAFTYEVKIVKKTSISSPVARLKFSDS